MLSLVLYLVVALLVGFAASRLLGLFVVEGESMQPSLRDGDWVLARRYLLRERPRRGNVVMVARQGPRAIMIKRVLATPGEVLPEEICTTPSPVPEGRYFLHSDNHDGRPATNYVGPVQEREICAKAMAVAWPPRRWRIVR